MRKSEAACAWDDNPNTGIDHFDSILWSVVAIFQSITLEGWVDMMYQLQDGVSSWVWIYFVMLVLIGAIIVIADDRKASTEVYFSWDEAMTWNELHYTDTGTEIENIVIEPQATSQVFVMYGSRGDSFRCRRCLGFRA